MKLNGGTVLSIGGQNESSASNSVLLQLEERDRVWVELIEGRLVEPHPDSAITSFLGYRKVFTRALNRPSGGNPPSLRDSFLQNL